MTGAGLHPLINMSEEKLIYKLGWSSLVSEELHHWYR